MRALPALLINEIFLLQLNRFICPFYGGCGVATDNNMTQKKETQQQNSKKKIPRWQQLGFVIPQVCFTTLDGYMVCNYTIRNGKPRGMFTEKWQRFKVRWQKRKTSDEMKNPAGSARDFSEKL